MKLIVGLSIPASAAIATSTAVSTATTITAAATATVTAAATTTATGRTWLARASFVHGQWPSFDGFAVIFRDCFLCIGLRRHSDECEAARFTGEFVLHQADFLHRPDSSEHILEIGLGRVEGKISYV
jgi:hypothetical protein